MNLAASSQPASPAPPAVRLRQVSKTYKAGAIEVKALENVSTSIPAHSFSMLVGPSGSGKTTLLNLIGCIDRPTEGTLEVAGRDVAALDDDEISDFRARSIGFIFQNFNLIQVLSAYENVEFPLLLTGIPAAKRRSSTLAMLAAVGLSGKCAHRPNQLSGGEKQRVAIARALVNQPKIVLADEPTANLDSRTGESIIELMRRIQTESKTTFIFSTHDLQLISHAEETFGIRDGKLVRHVPGEQWQ